MANDLLKIFIYFGLSAFPSALPYAFRRGPHLLLHEFVDSPCKAQTRSNMSLFRIVSPSSLPSPSKTNLTWISLSSIFAHHIFKQFKQRVSVYKISDFCLLLKNQKDWLIVLHVSDYVFKVNLLDEHMVEIAVNGYLHLYFLQT